MGLAPTNGGFADRSVCYFTTAPTNNFDIISSTSLADPQDMQLLFLSDHRQILVVE